MAQVLVRNLDDDVKERLRLRAREHGHSMEEEIRDILRQALADDGAPAPRLGSRIAARFAGRAVVVIVAAVEAVEELAHRFGGLGVAVHRDLKDFLISHVEWSMGNGE